MENSKEYNLVVPFPIGHMFVVVYLKGQFKDLFFLQFLLMILMKTLSGVSLNLQIILNCFLKSRKKVSLLACSKIGYRIQMVEGLTNVI